MAVESQKLQRIYAETGADAPARRRQGFARRGIELALLSIEADNPGIARNWVRIDDINEIQEAMVKLLSATRFRQALGQL